MRRWTTVIAILGWLFVLVSVATAFFNVVENRSIRETLIPLLPTVVLSATLVYGSYWLSRSDLHPDTHPRIGAWCFGGAAVLLVNVGFLVINPAIDINNPIQTVGLAVGIGAVAGFTIGVNEARAISQGREAKRGREVLGFLNSTLRHEVLNNVNVVRGTTTELAKESDVETRQQLDVIVNCCDSIAELIEDIGPVARTLTGRAALTTIDLSAMTSEQVDTVESIFPEATVTTEIEPDTTVRATEGLSHAILNVLSNAIEHNDTETPRVEVTLETSGEVARLRIADNGPGIDDAEKERIFDSKTDRDRGFGLYMVQTLLSSFDGDIRVEDNDPRGSVFIIELLRSDAG